MARHRDLLCSMKVILSGFSSRGPTWDGRVKPDICTPGQLISSVYSTPYMPYLGTMMLSTPRSGLTGTITIASCRARRWHRQS
ncbi:MAG: S8 family serine peptidase [Bacteroidales bacterium]|nr:S8 family serine peptidase [Bacteroidales bacterium]